MPVPFLSSLCPSLDDCRYKTDDTGSKADCTSDIGENFWAGFVLLESKLRFSCSTERFKLAVDDFPRCGTTAAVIATVIDPYLD